MIGLVYQAMTRPVFGSRLAFTKEFAEVEKPVVSVSAGCKEEPSSAA